MEVRTKLRNELRKHFEGDISGLEPVESGFTHETFFFSNADNELVVQALTGGKDKEYAIKRKAKVYEMAEKYSVDIPKLILGPENISFNGDESLYFVVRRAPGSEMKESFQESVLDEIGVELAKIHGMESFEHPGWVKPVDGGFEPFVFDDGSYEDWIISNLEDDIEVLRKNGMKDAADRAELFVRENKDNVPTDFEPVLCHNDYSPDNIITKNGEITGVIDFDYVFSSDPRRELVKAANSFQIEDIDIREKLYKNYMTESSLENFQEVEPFYRVETMVRIVASLFHLDVDPSQEEKEKYSKMINKAIEKPKKRM